MESDRIYYTRRAAEERAAAIKAVHPNVRQVHLELAACYELRLRAMTALDREAGAHLIDVA